MAGSRGHPRRRPDEVLRRRHRHRGAVVRRGAGEVYGFLGANGAGKTTTIRLLLDLLRPSRGRATVLGVDCHRDSLAARRLIGYLPGDLPIYPDLSARDYLAYLSRLDGRPVAAGLPARTCSSASTSARSISAGAFACSRTG